MFGKHCAIWILVIGSCACLMCCSSHALYEAQETVATADSLCHNGQSFSDSAQLAQAYHTLHRRRNMYPDEYAHGASNQVRLEDGTAIKTSQEMFTYLYDKSQEFKASFSAGKPSVLILHSCSTGSGENSFAQQISADELFSNTLVIAPSSVLEVGSKETISNAGFWIAFYKGKQVGTINGKIMPTRTSVERKLFFDNLFKLIINFFKHENE